MTTDRDPLDVRIERATGAAVRERAELDGGEVGTVYRVDLADGRRVVVKTGDTPLTVEAGMLRYLASETDLPVPAVLAADDDLLVLSFVPGDDPVTDAVERDAADHLAALHGVTADACGFPFDTLSGPLRQSNPRIADWTEFFREFRLRYVAGVADLPAALRDRIDALAADLDALLSAPDAPALVHGDVWTGNLVVDGDRVAAFLDPACYYGHPAMDLAYVRWTDTFGDPFFDRYRERRGLPTDFDRLWRVYALVPMLEHVWFFGDGYLDEVRRALDTLGY